MNHVPQTDLIRLAAGELEDARLRAVEEHLAACPACHAQYEAQVQLWQTLGEWTFDADQPDLVPTAEARLVVRAATRWALVGRAAAAVLIGVGVGAGAGRALHRTPPTPPTDPIGTEQAAMQTLGFGYFADPSPTGLYMGLLDISAEPAPQEGDQ